MSKLQNIRVEKKNNKIHAVPSLRDIKIGHALRFINNNVKDAHDMIVILVNKDRQGMVNSTFTNVDTCFFLDKVKAKFLED